MKCSKCGKKGKITDKFCSECGNNVSIISSKNILLVFLVFVFIVMLFCLYQLFCYLTGPKRVASRYFETVVSNNADSIYRYIEEYEDELFVSEEILTDKIETFKNINYYSIVKIEKKGNCVYVVFEYEENGVRKMATVELLEESFGPLKAYKVVSGKIASNITIRVLKDSIVTVDNKDISRYLVDDENDIYDTYVIPYMIRGKYEVDVDLENGLQIKEDIIVSSNGTYTMNELTLSSSVSNSIAESIKKDLNILYKGALEDKEYVDIDSFENDLSNLYKNIKRNLNTSFYEIKSIDFTDVEIKKVTLNKKGNMEVTVIADYQMKYSYEYNEKTYNKETKKYTYLTLEGTYIDALFEIIDSASDTSKKAIIYE